MDSIADILGKRSYEEPASSQKLRYAVQELLRAPCTVSSRKDELIVTVPTSFHAQELRFALPKLQKQTGLKERIKIRIAPSKKPETL
jgi:hypothetical protein